MPTRPSRRRALLVVASVVGLAGVGLVLRSGGDGPPPVATPDELAEAMVRSFQTGDRAVVAEMSVPGYVRSEDEIARVFDAVDPTALSNWCYVVEPGFEEAVGIEMYADAPGGSIWFARVPAFLVDGSWRNGFGVPGDDMRSDDPSTMVTGLPAPEEDDPAVVVPADCTEVGAEG